MEEIMTILFSGLIAMICFLLMGLIDTIQNKSFGESWRKAFSKIKIHFIYFIRF